MRFLAAFAHIYGVLNQPIVDHDCRRHQNARVWQSLADAILEICNGIVDLPVELVERAGHLAQQALEPHNGDRCVAAEVAAQILHCILAAHQAASGKHPEVHCRFRFISGLLSTDDILPLADEKDSVETISLRCCARPDCTGFRVMNGTYIRLGSKNCPSASLSSIKRTLNEMDIQVLLAGRFSIISLLDTWSAFWPHELPLGADVVSHGEMASSLSEKHESLHEAFVNRFNWFTGAFYRSVRSKQIATNHSNMLRDAAYFAIAPIGTFPENSNFWRAVQKFWGHAEARVTDFRLAYVALRCAYSTYADTSVTPWGGRSQDLWLIQDMFRHTTLNNLLKGAYAGLTALRIFSALKERHFEIVDDGSIDAVSPHVGISRQHVEEPVCREYESRVSAAEPYLYLTAVYGSWTSYLESWVSHMLDATRRTCRVVIVLVLDERAKQACKAPVLDMTSDAANLSAFLYSSAQMKSDLAKWICLQVNQALGLSIAKYFAMSVFLRLGRTVVWVDFDTLVLQDPTPWLENATSLVSFGLPESFNWLGDLHDALLFARPSAAPLISNVVAWLINNPMLASRPDHFIMAVIQHHTPYRPDGPSSPYGTWQKIVPMLPTAAGFPAYTILDGVNAYGSAFGWAGVIDHVFLFHLGGLSTASKHLVFEHLFRPGILSQEDTVRFVLGYRRQATYFRVGVPPRSIDVATRLGVPSRDQLWVEHVTYAENCCKESLKMNLASAKLAGVNRSRWYARKNLSASFEAVYKHYLDDLGAIGAGYWCWKPQVILQAMEDPSIPEDKGVVVWLDAGNRFIGNLDDIISNVLSVSDVTSHMNLLTVEWRFTKPEALELLPDGVEPYVHDTPQAGAPFIIARKTPLARRFLREWLDLLADRRIVSTPGNAVNVLYLDKLWKQTGIVQRPQLPKLGQTLESLEYQYYHLHDQAVYSTLFKRYGFKPLTSAQQERAISLTRDLS